MFNFIPLEYYSIVFYNFLLLIVVAMYFQSQGSSIDSETNIKNKRGLGIFVLCFVILYMGLRPVSGKYFGDMGRYAMMFNEYAAGAELVLVKDILFEIFLYASSAIMNVSFFFVFCAFLYCYPVYRISVKFFGSYWFYAFLIQVAGFSFWGGGANGIRNGLAAACFLWGLSQSNQKIRLGLLIGSTFIHGSLLLPTAAYLLTMFYKNTKMFLLFWLLCIPVSLAFGGFFEGFFFSLGFGAEERLAGYLTELDEGIANSRTGFRWDFLIYSASGVFSGWYFIVKRKFDDPVYTQLFNVFLLCNAFWVLVIRANFSNRFAYLSWFILGLVIIYPLLKFKFFNKQHLLIGRIIFVYFMVSYVLTILV